MTPQQIIDAWNAQADEANQWGALGEDEKLMWAYKQATAGTCPDCERYKQSASMWRNKAYELSGTPLPWEPEELLRKEYERGFIDGMQKQMQSSVDKAVNRMAQPNAYDNMLKAIDSMRPAARVIKDKPATWWLDEFEKAVRNLKEKHDVWQV